MTATADRMTWHRQSERTLDALAKLAHLEADA